MTDCTICKYTQGPAEYRGCMDPERHNPVGYEWPSVEARGITYNRDQVVPRLLTTDSQHIWCREGDGNERCTKCQMWQHDLGNGMVMRWRYDDGSSPALKVLTNNKSAPKTEATEAHDEMLARWNEGLRIEEEKQAANCMVGLHRWGGTGTTGRQHCHWCGAVRWASDLKKVYP